MMVISNQIQRQTTIRNVYLPFFKSAIPKSSTRLIWFLKFFSSRFSPEARITELLSYITIIPPKFQAFLSRIHKKKKFCFTKTFLNQQYFTFSNISIQKIIILLKWRKTITLTIIHKPKIIDLLYFLQSYLIFKYYC
jgi:hypothetical protein